MKRLKMAGTSKLHVAKSLEGTSLCNARSKKRNKNTKHLACTSLERHIFK
jgi:hypothetical protein